MNVFDKRPLSLILCILLGSFAFFTFGSTLVKGTVIVAGVLTLLFALFLAKEKRKKVIVILCSIAIFLSSFLSFLYFDLYFKAHKRFEGEVTVNGVITEYESGANGIEFTVKTDNINDKPFSKYKLKVYLSYGKETNLSVGNKITLSGIIEEFNTGDAVDDFNYNYATGISGKIDDVKSIEVIGSGRPGLLYYLRSYRDTLSRRIIASSDAASGGLMAAFLLGDRGYLSTGIETSFTRLGITHILALSGMHLVLLIGGFEKILAILGVNKKLRKILGILLCAFYVALTGFPASVLRAGIMLILASTLFLISERSDSITSLFISAFVIIVATPYAVYDVSLCLSVLATFGIVPFVERKQNDQITGFRGKIKEILKTVLVSIVLSTFAIGTTLVITTFQFQTISMLGIIATLIFSAITDPFLYLGVLNAIFGSFGPFGFITKIYGNAIIYVANLMSKLDGIYCSTNYLIIEILVVLFTACLIIFFIIKIDKRISAAIVVSSMLLCVFITSFASSRINESKPRIEYDSGTYGDRILLTKGNKTALIDISSGTNKATRETAEFMYEMKIYDIDKYVIMSYYPNMISGIPELIYTFNVDELHLPLPQNKSEEEILLEINSNLKLNKCKTKIIFFPENDDMIKCNDFTIAPFYRSTEEDVLAFTIYYQGKFYSYLSSGMLNDDNKHHAFQLMNGADTIIFGNWGENVYDYDFIYQIESAEQLIFSDKYMTVSDETLEFYASKNLYFTPGRMNLIR